MYKRVNETFISSDELLHFARMFAKVYHKGQQYDRKSSYYNHLIEVDNYVKRDVYVKKHGNKIRILAYLHDILEDTHVIIEEIAAHFGKEIADAVVWITDPPFSNRKTRKLVANQKFKHIPKEFEWVLIVKAADRLANVFHKAKNDMYLAEFDKFREAVYRPGLCDEIWEGIEKVLGKFVRVSRRWLDTKTMTFACCGSELVTLTEFDRIKKYVDVDQVLNTEGAF